MAPCCQPKAEAPLPAPQTTDPETADSEPTTAHPGCAHHLPHRFHGPTPPNSNGPITAFSEASETFNLDGISENDEDDEEPPIPRARGDILMDTIRSTPVTDPLMTDTRTNTPGTSADVHFFFMKTKGEESVCNHCRCAVLYLVSTGV